LNTPTDVAKACKTLNRSVYQFAPPCAMIKVHLCRQTLLFQETGVILSVNTTGKVRIT